MLPRFGKLNTKLAVMIGTILAVSLSADIMYSVKSTRDTAIHELERWSVLLAETVRVSLNTLMKEQKMDARFVMFDSMRNEIPGFQKVRVIRADIVNKIFMHQRETNFIPREQKAIADATRKIEELTRKLKTTTDPYDRRDFKSDIEQARTDITSAENNIKQLQIPLVVDPREMPVTEMDHKVLDTGKPQFLIDGDKLEVWSPYIAQSQCGAAGGCHVGIKIGQVIGAIHMEFSLEKFNSEVRRNVIFSAVGKIILSVLIIGSLLLMVTRIILRKLGGEPDYVAEVVHQVAEGNLSVQVQTRPGDTDSLLASLKIMVQKMALSSMQIRKLSRAVDQSPSTIIITDNEGVIEYVNPHFSQISGYTYEEAIGNNMRMLQSDGTPAGVYEDLWRTVKAGRVWRAELLNKSKQGKPYWEEFSISPIFDEHGNITHFLSQQVDITARKQVEMALKDAKIAAEEASRVKGEFLANMSHEIRTPLNAIIGLAYLAMKTEMGVKIRDYLGKIHFSGNHLLGVVNDILDLSKIEAGKLELEKSAFRVDRLMENISALIGAGATAKNLELVFDIDPAIPHLLRGDFLRISQVLVNYANNAIKFTERGNIIVRMKMLSETESDIYLRFEVEDTGIGLTTEQMDKLFQAFQQADSSTSRKFGGTGLGLAISKRIVGMMEGKVGVESEFGKGSIFWFSARLDKVKDVEAKEIRNPSLYVASVSDLEAIHGASILLAEDNIFNQEVAGEMLEQAGAKVTLAGNGKEALEWLRKARFDCVLMDVQMPEMDGMEATRLIRADPALAGLRVIALTANIMQADRERCFAAGMDDFIAKPFLPGQFYMTLAKWLPSKEQRPALTEAPIGTTTEAIPAVAVGDPATIDLSILAKTIGTDSEKIKKFSLRFIETARQGLDEMETALAEENAAALEMLGHRIKSSARSVGAIGYADLCQTLEQAGTNEDLKSAKVIVPQFRPLLLRIEAEIKRIYS